MIYSSKNAFLCNYFTLLYFAGNEEGVKNSEVGVDDDDEDDDDVPGIIKNLSLCDVACYACVTATWNTNEAQKSLVLFLFLPVYELFEICLCCQSMVSIS